MQRPWLILIVLVGLVSVPPLLLGGAAVWIENRRVHDAKPALAPLIPLKCLIGSSPVPFVRNCTYKVYFEEDTELSDANIAELLSLNHLPAENNLTVHIRTKNVTDKSMPVLKSLTKLDALIVLDSGISDDGIRELREAFPGLDIPQRKPE